MGGGAFGGGGGGGGMGGGGQRFFGGGGGGGYGQRTNAMGFHGRLEQEPALEAELFGGVHVNSGINFDKYDDIPVETSGENVPASIDKFEETMLHPALLQNTALAGYARPTPVQKYSIPIGHLGRDLMACAQTGSGKTGGFLFPTITAMCKRGAIRPPDGGRSRMPYPNCLIMAPTRELASQIFEEARKFCYRTGVRPVVVYGGADIRDQLREIDRGCDMIVATPGRLVDLMERGKMSLSCCRHLILDEADRMLVGAAGDGARARASSAGAEALAYACARDCALAHALTARRSRPRASLPPSFSRSRRTWASSRRSARSWSARTCRSP